MTYRRGGSVWVAHLEGCKWCPIARLEDHLQKTRGERWRELASETPVFQGQRQKDKVYKKEPTISFSTVYRHTERTFNAIRLDPAEYGCHSCRVGGATAAHLRGLSDEDTAKHGGSHDLFTMHGYLESDMEELLRPSRAVGIWEIPDA